MYYLFINWILFNVWKIIKNLILILINFKWNHLMNYETLQKIKTY